MLNSDGEIVTNAHVVTDNSSGSREPANEVFVEFPDRNNVPAEIVGFDPFADVALLEDRPRRARPAPAEARRRPRNRGRRAGRGDRQPVRRTVLALGRRDLRREPVGQIADPVPDRGSDPDRRLDQPRQLRRPAARRRRPGARDQPADRDELRRQRRRRVRRPGLGDQALGRPAGGRRHRRIRLHRRLQPGALPAARREARPRHRPSAASWRASSPAARPRRRGSKAATRNSSSRRPNTAPAAT